MTKVTVNCEITHNLEEKTGCFVKILGCFPKFSTARNYVFLSLKLVVSDGETNSFGR